MSGGGRRGEGEDTVGDGDMVMVGAVAYHAGGYGRSCPTVNVCQH